MKTVVFFLVVAAVVSSCTYERSKEDRRKDDLTEKYGMECSRDLEHYFELRRCENAETICYGGSGKLQCKFKTQ